jgi:hypothetical protein
MWRNFGLNFIPCSSTLSKSEGVYSHDSLVSTSPHGMQWLHTIPTSASNTFSSFFTSSEVNFLIYLSVNRVLIILLWEHILKFSLLHSIIKNSFFSQVLPKMYKDKEWPPQGLAWTHFHAIHMCDEWHGNRIGQASCTCCVWVQWYDHLVLAWVVIS